MHIFHRIITIEILMKCVEGKSFAVTTEKEANVNNIY